MLQTFLSTLVAHAIGPSTHWADLQFHGCAVSLSSKSVRCQKSDSYTGDAMQCNVTH